VQGCAEHNASSSNPSVRVTLEQVRSATNVFLDTCDLPPVCRRQRLEQEVDTQAYYQRRNEHARVSHRKARLAALLELGIDPDRIKSCLDPRPPT
jgi:hypothetical protein